jgi:enoyl-CoA hydratase/carnithine racemase
MTSLTRTAEQLRRRLAAARPYHRHGGEHRAPQATEVEARFPSPDVLEVRLVNGRRRNVLGREAIVRIERLVAEAPEATRVVLLSAEGPDFCAGYDLLEAAEGDPADLIAHEDNFAPLRRSSRPIVAALSGNVIGGGLELALAADVRIAARDTRFAIPACALGLVYSEAGTRLLVEQLGESAARAMLLGGKAIGAAEALAMGLVSEVVDPAELQGRAEALAAEIAQWSPVATAGNRQVLDTVTGRLHADVAGLRAAAFAPGGALAGSIAAFVARRQRPATPSRREALVQRGTALLRAGRTRGLALSRQLGRRLQPTP